MAPAEGTEQQVAADGARVTPTEPRAQEPRAAVTSPARPGGVTWGAAHGDVRW